MIVRIWPRCPSSLSSLPDTSSTDRLHQVLCLMVLGQAEECVLLPYQQMLAYHYEEAAETQGSTREALYKAYLSIHQQDIATYITSFDEMGRTECINFLPGRIEVKQFPK